MTMTEIGNVGRFVAAACLLPKGSRKEDFSMAGDTLKPDEVVKKIEAVRGSKMEVTFRPYEQVEKEEEEEQMVYPNKMWAQIEVLASRNIVEESILRPIVNELCPGVKLLTVEDYLKKFW
ncbi:hypothetical protein EK21DRAFT_115780 [Setomelanomma holmii]|uniref:Uncharacterized protein n=1 Tax=Setomelanomma holmii TaxID=210430 RepID=A0A9P4LJB9_9PLEO|nr:hypothetical protein EK21DRAFT_115780 [Setomelanomma holmii]